MRKPIEALFAAVWIAAIAASAALAAPADSMPSADEVLKTLRPGHPRLVALDSDIARVKRLIAENETARQYYETLKAVGVEWLKAKPVEHKLVGPRLLAQSRRCLVRVMTWSLLYRLDGDKRFAERAKKEMLTAAAFPDWNPRHFLDVAEMTHALAIGYDWLYDYLSPREREIIRNALVEKGLKEGRKVYERGGWWVASRFNWNQVCNGGMAIGALAVADEEPKLSGYILASALRSIPRAMVNYAPDGGWAEGPGYWHYATRYNVYFLAALNSALGTDFGLSKMEGFDKAGLFRIYFCGPVGLTFNYADAHDRAGRASEMFWLSRRFNRPLYAWHERNCEGRPDAWDLLWFDPRGKGPRETGLPLDAYFRGVEVVFLRSAWEDPGAIFVGFKGGDNKANHSHLDLGSFVLDALGKRWAVDLGPDNYNLPAYFGKKRWTYFRLRTESHNTLVINGKNQRPKAKAPILAFSSKPDRAYAVTDLSQAYAPDAKRVLRGIALLDRKHILVEDEIAAPRPVEVTWAMLTPAKVSISGSRADLAIGERHLALEIVEPSGARFDTMSANPPPPQRQQPGVTKLVVNLPGKVENARIAVTMTPYFGKQKPPAWTGKIEPLARWVEEAR